MVYIEEIIIIDTLIHIFFVNITGYICYFKIKKINLFLSGLINVFSILCYIYLIKNILINLLFSIVVGIISFYRKTKKNYIKEVLIYLIINICFGGINQLFYYEICCYRYFTFGLLICFVISSICFLISFKKSFNKSSLLYDFIIINNNKKYKFKLYLDTGNFLQSSDNLPIIVLNDRCKIGTLAKNERCYSITGSKELKLYKVDAIYKMEKKIEAYVTYATMEFDGLFGLNI